MSDVHLDLVGDGNLDRTRTSTVGVMLSLAAKEVNKDFGFVNIPLDHGFVNSVVGRYSQEQAMATAERIYNELAGEDIDSIRRPELADCMETAISEVLDGEIGQREIGYSNGTGQEIVLPRTNLSLIKSGLQIEFGSIATQVSDVEIIMGATHRTARMLAMRRLTVVGDFLADALHEVPEIIGTEQIDQLLAG